MCGRYALGVRMAFVRQRMQEQGLPVDEAPNDDQIRETYNFAPGYNGAVYRGDTPDRGYDESQSSGRDDDGGDEDDGIDKDTQEPGQYGSSSSDKRLNPQGAVKKKSDTKYKIQKMRWGLIPFWTKRQPDYGSMMRTINCRDDSLIEDKGMWTSMKRRKRCVIICQGFYEWLKKGPGGKEKVPHFTKHKDGDLMYFAGLWDCVQYEGSDEKLYTYTIITTDSNSYLKFLHDRMPVILDPGSEQMKLWLDPHQTTWTKELQSILKPYEGELECYPVSKEVGKVGNNSPNFLVPVDSKENKSNIANFFANASAKKTQPSFSKGTVEKDDADKDSMDLKDKSAPTAENELAKIEKETESRETVDGEWTEDNAPKPVPQKLAEPKTRLEMQSRKRELSPDTGSSSRPATKSNASPPRKIQKSQAAASEDKASSTLERRREMKSATTNKTSSSSPKNARKGLKHATSSSSQKGTQRITDFFKK